MGQRPLREIFLFSKDSSVPRSALAAIPTSLKLRRTKRRESGRGEADLAQPASE